MKILYFILIILINFLFLGGSTLFIETTIRKSSKDDSEGSIELTGHLGNIMKESVKIALTVARNIMKQTDSNNKFLEKR